MGRIRLTSRTKMAEDKTMCPSRVNQEDRPVVDMGKYDNYKEVAGWETQDMNHDWKSNPRDEVGMGVPKIAAIYATSQQAVRLATLFLGDKVKENMIEAQARDFMRLGSRRLSAALERFNESSALYAADEPEAAPVVEAPVAAIEEQLTETAPAAEVEKAVKEIEAPVTAADEEELFATEDAEVATEENDDIFAGIEDESNIANEDEDAEMDSIFADEQMDDACDDEGDVKPVAARKTASKKAGIKKLGGNLPKASTKVASVDDLSGVWSDAPDVTSIF